MNGFQAVVLVSVRRSRQTRRSHALPAACHGAGGAYRKAHRQGGRALLRRGRGQPDKRQCRRQAALRPELDELGPALYGQPELRRCSPIPWPRSAMTGSHRALALVTSAYGGYSSCRQYLDDISAARAAVGPGAPEISKLRLFDNHPGWGGRGRRASARRWTKRTRPPRPRLVHRPVVLPVGRGRPRTWRSCLGDSMSLALARTSPYAEHVTETRACAPGGPASGPGNWSGRAARDRRARRGWARRVRGGRGLDGPGT